MVDGQLAVIGLGSIGSMALWQASRLSDSATGFEAASPAHGRSINGAEHEILSREEMAERYPQHNLRADDIAVYDPHAGALRTDRAVTAAVAAAQANGATVHSNTAIDGITETTDGVVITSGERSWTFENVIVSSGGWSQRLMPDNLKAATQTKRIFLTWFVAKEGGEFAPENFPVFIRIHEDRSMYGAPAVDRVTVKATLDGRGGPTPAPDAVPRELTPAEITETTETVTEFFPGLFPSIVRSDAFPDLFTTDGHPLLGRLKEGSRIYCATGFSGGGFKNSTGFGEIAAHEALGKRSFDGLDFVRPERFKAN